MHKYLLTLFLFLSTSASQAEIYKWVDDEGKIHYGDKPSTNSDSQALDVNIDKSGNQDSTKHRKDRQEKLLESLEESRKRKEAAVEKKKKDIESQKRKCAIAKRTLNGYERAGYLYGLDKEGNKVIRTNEEREKATEAQRNKVKKLCK